MTTLDGVRGLADTGRISENAYNFLYNMLSGKSAIADYNKFDIPSFTMTVTDTRKDLYFTFDFTVKDSSLDTLPDGEYHWRMTDGVDCFRADEETDNSFADVEEVRMLKAFLTRNIHLEHADIRRGRHISGNEQLSDELLRRRQYHA